LPTLALANRSSENVVRRNAEKPRDDLSQREAPAVTLLTDVCGKYLERLVRDLPVTIDFVAQSRRKAF
jgi:hypothetical protein